MRFYLDLPLFIGYVLMAITACLGMLQFAGARGDYAGLSLFTADRKRGVGIGAGLTASALLAYVLFAPEILTPGPAGTEVAEMFAFCALVALAITLLGADRRMKRERLTSKRTDGGEKIILGHLTATFHCPTSTPSADGDSYAPVVVLLPDPAGFVAAPATLVDELCHAGVAVLALDARGVSESDAPLSRRTLLGHLSAALSQLAHQPGIDGERIGLIGLGLGGDAVFQAAAAAVQVKAVLAVSPVGGEPSPPDGGRPGLHWLRELSYPQVWRVRRRWPDFQRAAAELDTGELRQGAFPATAVVIQGRDAPFTIRKCVRQIEHLATPGERHFTLLDDERTRQLVVSWLQEKLKNHAPHAGAARGRSSRDTSDVT